MSIVKNGGDGVISVIANAYPKEFTEMVDNFFKGNYSKAEEINLKLANLIESLFLDGSPGGIKAMLEIKGLCKNIVRLPLVKINNETYNIMKKLVSEF